jgi:hypothetical protein
VATEFVASLRPLDLQREMTLGSDPELVLCQPVVGDLRGLPLPKYKTAAATLQGYTGAFRIPANLTMGTGLTFKIYLTDDGTSAVDLGKKVYIGITAKRIINDETVDIDAGGATEAVLSITLSTTSGGVAIGSMAIAAAALDSLAVGELALIRIRRKGTDATNDTCPGRAVLLGVEVQNT